MDSGAPRQSTAAVATALVGTTALETTAPVEATPAAATAAPVAGRLHRQLSSFGVLLLTLSCLSPVVGVYGMGSEILQQTGTGAAGLFLIGIGAAVIWAMVYAELGSAYPYAGGDYVGVGSILGPWAGFACLALWGIILGPSEAFFAKATSVYVVELVPALPPQLVTFCTLGLAVAISLLAVRTSAMVTGVFLGIEMLAILALLGAGFWHPVRGLASVIAHPLLPAASGAMVPVAIGVLTTNAVSAVFSTVGGNQAIAFGEELTNPHRHMGRVILWACMIGACATGLPIIAVVVGAHAPATMFRSAAPLTTFIDSIGGPIAGRALSAGVALAIFNATVAGLMFSARLLFSFGRDAIFSRGINRLLASVHGPSGAPRAATCAVGLISAGCCLFSSNALLVFISGLVVYSFALVSFAVLIGRIRRLTGRPGYWRSPLYPLMPLLGLCLAVVLAVADLFDKSVGRPSLLILGGMVAVSLLWYAFVLRHRPGGWTPRMG